MKPTPITSIPASYALDVQARIIKKTERAESGCWLWQGPLDRSGYGKIKLCTGTRNALTGSHRAAWLAFRGAIERDLQIDHLCRVRQCCNPDHLEVVTPAENVRRSEIAAAKEFGGSRRGRPRLADADYSCSKHGRQEGKIRVRAGGRHFWHCSICNRNHVNAFNARKRAARAALAA